MSQNFGNGVSRVLDTFQRNYTHVIFQKRKPPLDSELNALESMHEEEVRQSIQSSMPSGFLFDPTLAEDDFEFSESWSNFFVLGKQRTNEKAPVIWANVNGWVIPVSGTEITNDVEVKNLIKLYPSPQTDARIDYIFLEVWRSLVGANPSTTNKPSASTVWKYGNVKYGGTNYTDDLQDPEIGFETSKRVQIQYRIRVFGAGSGLGSGAALDIYPDGLGDPNILGQGNSTSPVGSFVFQNMREELGDPSLWRAGNGDSSNGLSTIDGYSYAVPICAIFRRNSATFVAVNSSGNPNQNGAFDRNPSARLLADPLTGAKPLSQPTLLNAITSTSVGLIDVQNLIDSGIDDPSHSIANLFLVIDNEIIGISAYDTTASPQTISIPGALGRGRWGTAATGHPAGSLIRIFNSRSDSLYADQIAPTDLLDLRRCVNPQDWDYTRLLTHNLAALFSNTLNSGWKKSAIGDTQGVFAEEVDYLDADGTTPSPNMTEALDGPDGIRTIFSDAAALQTDVTVMCDNDAPLINGYTSSPFDATVAWDVGADFKPFGFMNNEGATGSFKNGTSIFLFIGGSTGEDGARATFRASGTRATRFLSPQEYWNTNSPSTDPIGGKQNPVQVRFLKPYALNNFAPGEPVADSAKHPGPLYPWRDLNFEKPLIVLGGILNSQLQITGLASATSLSNPSPHRVVNVGIDFEAANAWYKKDINGDFINDPTQIANPVLNGTRTLYSMLTNDGKDITGESSEVYVVLHGDAEVGSRDNNGAFRVVGVGSSVAGMTTRYAPDKFSIVVEPLSADYTQFNTLSAGSVNVDFRSQHTTVEDGAGSITGPAALVVVLTDLGGLGNHPWNKKTLGNVPAGGIAPDYSLSDVQTDKLVINTTLLYSPNRGGTARVPDEIWRVALVNGGSEYLHQAPSVIDSAFPAQSGVPTNETYFNPSHVQTWNRLASLGQIAPFAPAYGGAVISFSEQDREAELFFDKGSKTYVFRPYQNEGMTLQAILTACSPSLLGALTYPVPFSYAKDGGTIFTTNKTMAYPVPQEYMPRFGRQDIPYHRDLTGTGAGTFLEGINHLFKDNPDPTNPAFYIIGGEDNISAGNQVRPLFFQTGVSGLTYSQFGTTIGAVLNKPVYQARKTNEVGTTTAAAKAITERFNAVSSSDLGTGLRGIQLPPYLGIARLYGVYDRADYIAKGGSTYQADRITPEADPPKNLLRKDATKQTLFIFQDGAEDFTTTTGDHTYIIPQDALDLTLSPNYVAGAVFEDFDYVVECVVFGFAQGWINLNNYVLSRKHTGAGVLQTEGTQPLLEDIPMVLAGAASLNDEVYIGYKRTVYQGDPYMTRNGETRTTSDYEHRYGQILNANAMQLNYPIQQVDSSGNSNVETPNLRKFEVLASVDFYTTMGTGNIGGRLYPGTILDVGGTQSDPTAASRIPVSLTAPKWQIQPRSFTEGQQRNLTRATAVLEFSQDVYAYPNFLTQMFDATVTIHRIDGGSTAMIAKNYLTYNSSIPEHFLVNPVLDGIIAVDFAPIAAGASATQTAAFSGVQGGEYLIINVIGYDSGLVTEAYVSALDTITIRVTNASAAPIDPVSFNFYVQAITPLNNITRTPSTNAMNAVARNLSERLNAHPDLSGTLTASHNGTFSVTMTAVPVGAEGNQIAVSIRTSGEFPPHLMKLHANIPNNEPATATRTRINFSGGSNLPVNGGSGFSPVNLTGMTERFPLGILVQDSDFLGENILGDNATAVQTIPSSVRPVQTELPLTTGGQEFTKFLGAPGDLIGMSDGKILGYSAYHIVDRPAGTKRFRLFRGGGSCFVLSGKNPGGPVDWVSQSFSDSLNPVLKGAVLAGKALLVRNYPEVAFNTNTTVSEGDEIQMVIITNAIYGDGTTQDQGVSIGGTISPTGYGEAYAASDRYRLNGKPMFRGRSRRTPDTTTLKLAIYPGRNG